jgi:hypothetical protein
VLILGSVAVPATTSISYILSKGICPLLNCVVEIILCDSQPQKFFYTYRESENLRMLHVDKKSPIVTPIGGCGWRCGGVAAVGFDEAARWDICLLCRLPKH